MSKENKCIATYLYGGICNKTYTKSDQKSQIKNYCKNHQYVIKLRSNKIHESTTLNRDVANIVATYCF